MAKQRTNKCDGYKKLNGGGWIKPERRLAIYMRDNFCCLYCGKDMKADKGGTTTDLTLDHLVCRVNGGDNGNENLVTACRACNSARCDKPYTDYATGGAIIRIEQQRREFVNVKLAKEIRSASFGANADVETR